MDRTEGFQFPWAWGLRVGGVIETLVGRQGNIFWRYASKVKIGLVNLHQATDEQSPLSQLDWGVLVGR